MGVTSLIHAVLSRLVMCEMPQSWLHPICSMQQLSDLWLIGLQSTSACQCPFILVPSQEAPDPPTCLANFLQVACAAWSNVSIQNPSGLQSFLYRHTPGTGLLMRVTDLSAGALC